MGELIFNVWIILDSLYNRLLKQRNMEYEACLADGISERKIHVHILFANLLGDREA